MQGYGFYVGCEAEATPAVAYFFINSSTAAVIAFTPARMVGSGTGANNAECSDGTGFPVRLLSARTFASVAPSQNITAGIWFPSKANLPKSSAPMTGGTKKTLSLPSSFVKTAVSRSVNAGLL